MAQIWLSVEEAAERLKVSVRTIWRRIQQGAIPTRTTDEGRRLVQIDTPLTEHDIHADTVSVLREQADKQLQVAGAALGQARELSEHLTGELKSAKRSARWAWALLLVLILAGSGGLWWATRAIMGLEGRLSVERLQGQAKADRLSDRLSGAEKRLSEAQGQLVDVRQAVQEQRDHAEALTDTLTVAQGEIHRLEAEKAHIEGELAAAKARPSWWGILRSPPKP